MRLRISALIQSSRCMQKNLLHVFLKRVADKDPESLKQVPQKLAERLVYVPVVKTQGTGTKDDSVVIIKARKIISGKKASVLTFSNQRFFKEWATTAQHPTSDVISLLLGDLCTAILSEKNLETIVIDYGAEHSLTLDTLQMDATSRYVSPLFFDFDAHSKPSATVREFEAPTEARTAAAVKAAVEKKRPDKKGFFSFLKK